MHLDSNKTRAAADDSRGLVFLGLVMALGLLAVELVAHGRPPSAVPYRLKLSYADYGAGILLAGNPLPINSITRNEWMFFPGIGPKLADRIIAARNRRGGFAKPRDLLKVRGLGPKKFNVIQLQLTLDH